MQLRKAERKQTFMKLGIQSPSGHGKTMSALLLAKGLVGDLSKVVVIDSERSADLYAHLGDYQVLTLDTPLAPKQYIKAIEVCKNAGMELIIIDSLSHAWTYLKNYHAGMSGNAFQNWAKLKPLHKELIDTIVRTPIHFICTLRTKHDYIMTEVNGKILPRKVGLKAETTNDTEYELSILFELDVTHQASAVKDRTGLFSSLKIPFIITEETGAKIKEWCEKGVKVEDVAKLIKKCKTIDELNHLYRKYPELYDSLEPAFKGKKLSLTNSKSKAKSNGVANIK